VSALETDRVRRRRRWKVVLFGPFVAGILALLLGLALGYELAGTVGYLLGIVLGTVACGVFKLRGEVTLYDERFDAIAKEASHYTYLTAVYLGLATFPLLFVLEAAGEFAFDPLAEGVLYSFSALGLTWGAYYTVLKRRS
jgi:hypothetical protein